MKNFIKIAVVLIFCACFFSVIILTKAQSAENSVRFAQISDIHLHDSAANRGNRMLAHSAELFKDAVEQINEQGNVDFVVFTGDMIDVPSVKLLKQFISIADNLKPQWFWTTGNHDIGGVVRPAGVLKLLNERKPSSASNGITKTYYSFKVKNFVFLCMDGVMTNKITANGLFSAEQLRWLEAQLKANKDSYVVIFQHYPLVEPFQSKTHYVMNAQQYLNILDKHNNVVAVISGHYHAAKIKMRNNVAHISSPSLIQYPNAFRIFTLKAANDEVTLKYEFFPTRLTEIREKSAISIHSPRLHVGSESDRNGTITLHKPLGKPNRTRIIQTK